MDVWIALGITLLAGLATGIGSIIAFTAQRTNYRFLSVATGFSAGVMLYVSFVEIFFKGLTALTERFGDYWGHWINAGSFFGGMLLIGLIDNLIPAGENPHEIRTETETRPLHDDQAPLAPSPEVREALHLGYGHGHTHNHHKLMRMGLFTALAIGIHNFPEGLATFLAALENPHLGIAIAIAIALHNIPEGISVSVPIFYATGDRKRAFLYSLLSGLAEPVGAGVAYLILLLLSGGQGTVVPPELMGILFGGVAGIMVYISLDELLPTSRAYGKGHDSLFGLVAGMGVMALSLLLMR
ncbi:zinc transporter ZupT [Propionivibrio sp.]|uniref:zinc transporter ZupT n=1 Tax=Propionivibrio sp. TaxID=2212460 RepID=UPI00272E057A|nr:zinc transporter ZupT [Propionivibrio sp.]